MNNIEFHEYRKMTIDRLKQYKFSDVKKVGAERLIQGTALLNQEKLDLINKKLDRIKPTKLFKYFGHWYKYNLEKMYKMVDNNIDNDIIVKEIGLPNKSYIKTYMNLRRG